MKRERIWWKKLMAVTLCATLTMSCLGSMSLPAKAAEESLAEGETATRSGDQMVRNQLATPSLELKREEYDSLFFTYHNNEETTDSVYLKLATLEEIQEGVTGGIPYSNQAEEEWNDMSLRTLLSSGRRLEAGEYYLTAYTQNDEGDLYSDVAVVEEFPILVTDSEVETPVLYQTGKQSGVELFTENPRSEYDYGKMILQVAYSWGESNTVTRNLNTQQGYFCFDEEEYNNNYDEWSIESVVFGKMVPMDNSCSVEQYVYTSAVKGEEFEEPKAEAPTITVDYEEEGNTKGIYLQNNHEKESCVYYGLATEEEIETEEVYDFSSESISPSQNVWVTSLENIILSGVSKTGVYYITARTECENEIPSELVVLEEYPLTITVNTKEETLESHQGEFTGYVYFPEKSVDEYHKARVKVAVTDERGDSWSQYESLYIKDGVYYLNTYSLNGHYESWAIEAAEFCKIDANDTGCTAIKEIYPTVTEGEAYEEAQAEAPTLTLNTEENALYVQNNDEEYSCVYYGLSTEEEIETGNVGEYSYDWLGHSETTWGTSLTNLVRSKGSYPGEYYIAGYTENDTEARSELTVLADYPINIAVTVKEETLEYQIGNLTGYGYFTGKSADEYSNAYATILIPAGEDDAWTEEWSLSKRNGYFYLDTERLDTEFEEWTVERIEFYQIDVTENGCTASKESYLSVVEGETYEEPKAEAPTITLEYSEFGDIEGISVQNNDEEYSYVYYGLATEEEIESGEPDWYDYEWLENSETSNVVYFSSLIRSKASQSGVYYVFGYAQNNNKAVSEVTVLEDYPISLSVTEMEEPLEYQVGDATGYAYVPSKSPEEYSEAKATVRVTDEWEDSWTETWWFHEINGVYYFDIDEEYVSWNVEQVEFSKINKTDAGYTVVKEIYTSVEEGEAYEEPRATAPTIILNKGTDEEVPGIYVRNTDEDYSKVYYGLASEEEIENGDLDWYSYDYLENFETVWGASLSSLLQAKDYESGVYYIAAYTENDMEVRSELTVLEDYPITIAVTEMEDTLEYQIGDMSGYAYFNTKSIDVYDYAKAWVRLVDDDDDWWTTTKRLYAENGMYFLDAAELEEDYGSWSIEKVEFRKTDFADDGCTVTKELHTSTKKNGVFEEPKAESPTVDFYKNDAGEIIGVKITNRMTHDDGYLVFGYYRNSKCRVQSWETVKAGETKQILFKDINSATLISGEGTFYFKCRAYDDREGLYSQYVTLDYPITKEYVTYTGEEVVLYKENDGFYDIYYMDAAKLPKETCDVIVQGTEWNVGLEKTADQSQWIGDTYYEVELERIDVSEFSPGKTGMKYICTQIPKGKIKLQEREYSAKEVLLLDYDYYNAFIASGGTISIDQNKEVVMSTENFTTEDKWTLAYLYEQFTGTEIYTWVKDISDTVKAWANQYWHTDQGVYKAENYYDTKGNVIANESLSKYDIVLVEYAPEIVWVDSMKLTAPKTMAMGSNGQVSVALDAGQDKYPFNRQPQLRYESDSPDVLTVDAKTGKLTTGKVTGAAKITVYADEALRAEEGLTDIVTASVEITVTEPHEHEFIYKLGTAATFDKDGKFVGKCSCGEMVDGNIISKVTSVKLSATSYTYNGSAKKPTVTVKDSAGKTLKSGTDYTVSYANNSNAGTATATVTLKGNYAGTVKKTFTIQPKAITGCTVTLSKTKMAYTGSALKPTVTVKSGTTILKSGTDYTVTYSNNTKPGKATVKVTGKGNYTGTESENFIIVPKQAKLNSVTSTSAGKVKITWTKDSLASGYTLQYSTSSSFTSSTTKTVDISKNSTTSKTLSLKEGKTYYIRIASYKTVDDTDYAGSYSAKTSVKVKSSFTVKAISDKTYTGSAIKPTIKVVSGSKSLTKNTDYTVSYSNNKNPGKATVTIQGKGDYAGTKKVTFNIVPKKATLSKLTSTKKGALTVKWNKDSKADGYVIMYSTSSKFTKSTTKTVAISKNSTTSKTISNLKSGKKYYVKVASYKKIDSVKEYGKYSSVKSLKVK